MPWVGKINGVMAPRDAAIAMYARMGTTLIFDGGIVTLISCACEDDHV
jgi:hypothetical protein